MVKNYLCTQGGEFFLLQKSLLIVNMLPTLAFFLSYILYYRRMSSVRQPSEWGIGKVKSLFSYLEYKVLK